MSKGTLTNSLFRQQAIDEQKDRLYGDVILTQPFSFYLITSGIFLIVVCVILMLVYGTYARRETVIGYLVPDKGLVKIYAPLRGILSKKHIKEGQEVSNGDILFTVSTLQANEKGSDRDTLLLGELEQQKSELQKKIIQEQAINEASIKSLVSKAVGIKHELNQLGSTILLQQKKVKLSTANLSRLNKLFSKGHIPKNQVTEYESTLLDSKIYLQSLKNQLIQRENSLSDLKQQQKQVPLEWQSRVIDFKQNLSEIEQRMVEISGRRIYTIRAPVSGRLTALQIFEGQTITSQSPLIAILPEGTDLHVELFLPTRAAGFIEPEQSVYLRYGAFPYQHYGLHKGRVSNIAQVILAPNELPIPVTLNEPVYRVKVELENQSVVAFGKEFPLQAGMLLDADIVLEKRTLGQWLLEPIYGLRGKL